jgi:phytoene dehydrogenase-like protein
MATQASKSDVIIIGGGHNGLVCAGYLAKAGRSVRVFEARDVLGGAAILASATLFTLTPLACCTRRLSLICR